MKVNKIINKVIMKYKQIIHHLKISRNLLIIILFSFLLLNCTQHQDYKTEVVFGDSLYLANVPKQPGEETWKFIEDLKSPLWTKHDWNRQDARAGEANLAAGVSIRQNFPDPYGLLETAYNDLKEFLTAGNVSFENGPFIIETKMDGNLDGEAFKVETSAGSCCISAGHPDGIRRGIFYVEDEMLSARGPFLAIGITEKKPVILRRISRCFFGPIKRPPAMRDELKDDVDYYPDNYLNRLAHEGVNGLWLTIEFQDLVSTKYTPEAGKDAEKRLQKLRQTVDKCLRYGIKTYIFCIEPRAINAESPVIKNYPELAGHKSGNRHFFCPMSETAHDYLYQSVNKIFSSVPNLGGLINITHGERGTTCLSAVAATADYKGRINCPRCSDKEPWEILHSSLSAMEAGMHDAAPEAELISWLYMPQPQRYVTGDPYSLGEWVYDLPAHTPEGVILQFNFESGVTREEFGKLLVGGDYWISKPGPSERFERIATVAREHGTHVSAKIQTGSSHEVATAPFIPVPSLLYRKFKAMHRLGVSHTMLCWYFGNYPGLMNKSAGLLAMNNFPENEDIFLKQLASIYWKEEDVPKVVEAWKHFSEGYENYPLTNLFQYYGPMHDGPVWPLLVKPADAPLSPTWQIGSSSTLKPWPPSGDRIGECIGEILTLGETTELAKRMTDSWSKGVSIFNSIEKNYKNDPERILDIGVAKALGIQFRTCYNILNFYSLREKMLRLDGRERLKIPDRLKDIIKEEIDLNEQLLELCRNDSRLGFHSEAEGYKYFPEKIIWRIGELEKVLKNDIPEIKEQILNDEPLFPEYTGKKPEGAVAGSISAKNFEWSAENPEIPDNLHWLPMEYGIKNSSLQWASVYDKDDLFIFVTSGEASDENIDIAPVRNIQINIEPRRLWPVKRFYFSNGNDEQFKIINSEEISYAAMRIPLKSIFHTDEEIHPVRLDIRADGLAWRPNNPLTSRLMLGNDNPADLGWLIFN